MKITFRALFTLFLIGFMIVSGSCTKEESAPAGPRGAAGPAGTSPLYSVGTFTVNSWTASGNAWVSQIGFTQITQSIVDNGTIQVFIQYGTEWWALPDIDGKNSTVYGFAPGYVSLINSNSDFTPAVNPGVRVFKIVIISQIKKQDNPDVDWTDYKEVKRVLKLKD